MLLCALFFYALSPFVAAAQNKEVRMELTPKTVEVDDTPIDFYDDGGPDGKTSPDFKDDKTSHVTFVPTVPDKKVQVDFQLVDIFEGSIYTQFIRVYDGKEVRPDRLLATVRKGTKPLLKATNAEGALTIAFGSNTSFTSNGFKAVVSLFVPQPMSLAEVKLTPMKDATVAAGDTQQPLLAFNIRTQETEPALALTALKLKTSGPIAALRLYQSTSPTDFSAVNNIGEATIENGVATLYVTSKPALRMGDNYFWLACDVKDEAENGSTVAVSIDNITLSDGQHVQNPMLLKGERVVENTIYALEGTQQRRVNGELTFKSKQNTYNDKYEGGNKDRITTFIPLHEGHVVQVDFSQFDLLYASNSYGVRAKFVVYEGIGTNGRKLWGLTSPDDKQRGPGQRLRSQAPDGALTIVFNPKDSHQAAKGFTARVSEYMPKAMTLAGVDVQQASTESVAPGATRQALLLINVKTEGNLQPIALKGMSLDLKTSAEAMDSLHLFAMPDATMALATNAKPLASIDKAHLNKLQDIALKNPLALAEGDNWLLLCADVAIDAAAGTLLDAALLRIETSLGTTQTAQGDPDGARTVVNEIILKAGNNGRIEVPENTTFTLYDDGGKANKESKKFDGIITFVPKTPGMRITIKALSWDAVGADKLEVYFATDKKDKPDATFSRQEKLERLFSTADNGAMTLRYTTGSYAVGDGFAIEVSTMKPRNLAVSELKTEVIAPTKAFKGQADLPLMHITIGVKGDKGVLNISQIRANLQGNAPTSIYKVYATDQHNRFAPVQTFATGSAESGIFDGSYNIEKEGEYHFWLTADIKSEATAGQTLAASIENVTANAETILPQTALTATTSIAQGMSGTLNVGPNAEYKTIQSAIDALRNGVDGPVVVSIESGKYNERVSIPHIEGLSETNTLTLKPASGKRGDVHIFHDKYTKGAYKEEQMEVDYGVITLDGADYTTLQALEVSTEDVTYPGIVHLRNESRHVTIDDCYLHAPFTTNTQAKITLVNMYAKSLPNANNDHFALLRSRLEGGYNGLRLGGTGTVALPKERGGRVEGNTFNNQGAKALYVAREADARIEGNNIDNNMSNHADFSAIDIDATGETRVLSNRISLATKEYCSAIYVREMSGTAAKPALMANNAVRITHDQKSQRKYASRALSFRGSVANLLVAHNTLCVEGNEKDITVGIQSAMRDNVRMVNNIFANKGKGSVYQFTRKTYLGTVTLDHNNLFTNGATLAEAQGNVSSITEWMKLSGERYAYFNMVNFAADVLLQPLNAADLRHAVPLVAVPTDILGLARSTTTPLMGAYERAWDGTSTAIVAPNAAPQGIVLSANNGVLALASLPSGAVVDVFSTAGTLLAHHVLPTNANNLQLNGLPQGVVVVRIAWNNGRWSKAIKL